MMIRHVLLICAAAAVAGSRLRAPGNGSNASVNNHTQKVSMSNHTQKLNVSQVNVTATPQRNLTDMEKVEKLQDGLKSIQSVQALFVARANAGRAGGAEKFAEGALTEELSKKDSEVWSVISAMVASTEKVVSDMKGKSKDEQKKIMNSLEAELDNKAVVLHNVTEDAGKRQVVQDEEYVLGLLNMHKKEWSVEKQLETVKKFMGNSAKLAELYKHHNSSQPLATQLAVMMDSKAQPKVAAKMFLQLLSELH